MHSRYVASHAKFKWRTASLPHDEIRIQSRWRDTSIGLRPAVKSLLERLADLRFKRTKWTTAEFPYLQVRFVLLWRHGLACRHVKLGPVSRVCVFVVWVSIHSQGARVEGVDVERDVHKWDGNNVNVWVFISISQYFNISSISYRISISSRNRKGDIEASLSLILYSMLTVCLLCVNFVSDY